MKLIELIALLGIVWSGQSVALNCQLATTEVEKQLCSDNVLQQLDIILNKIYIAKKQQTNLLVSQRQWLAKRDVCPDKECIKEQYLLRVNELVTPQYFFFLEKASQQQNLALFISCNEISNYSCEGEAEVLVFTKQADKPLQIIKMENMFIELVNNQPTTNLIELYGENNSGIVIDDINFDGIDDLALRNGNYGAYGGPSYSIYLFNKKSNSYQENTALTELASTNLGLFTIDPQTKTLETFTKSGCCWHQTSRYKLVNNKPLLVYEFTEEMGNGENVKLTTRKLVKGKWQTDIKEQPANEYDPVE